jgi:hypothetical protein
MKLKKILTAVLIASMVVMPLLGISAKLTGYWTCYTYTEYIPRGMGFHADEDHSSGQYAYAVLISSTGECTFVYEWNKPVLSVDITNDDTKGITVTWKEYYYEN